MSQSERSDSPDELRRLVDAIKRGDAAIASTDPEAWRSAPWVAIKELDGIIRELWGSYRSLVAVTGRDDALLWDGPSCVKQQLGDDF